MRTIITGGAGFIGSNLARTLAQTDEIRILDNFSTGDSRFLGLDSGKFELNEIDISKVNIDVLEEIMDGFDRVFHIAANADVRGGWNNHRIDLDQNIIATSNVAEAARRSGVKEVIFASTGCVYGDSTIIPTSEKEPFPIQTSLYGASKVAAEGILSSYAAQGAFNVTVFRFVSVLGQNYHHGHVVDFVRKLRADPRELEVLGNGTQKKSYIHVEDCVRALIELRNLKSSFEVFNIGHEYFIPVQESAKLVVKSMDLSPKIVFGTEDRGWIGDNPFTFLDISKAKSFGWTPTISIEESVAQTVHYLLENEWVLSRD
jgi:UDP-glucose 4-epimerase